MNPPTILIAGIGNIFFGDDAFGSEVARRLLEESWPENVQVADFGIRSIDLVYALLDGYDATILIDATQRGGAPGTLYVIEPEVTGDQLPEPTQLDGHKMDPVAVLAMARQMGAPLGRILLVGCEPAVLESDQGQLGCSPPVAAAFEEAIGLVRRLATTTPAPQPPAPAQSPRRVAAFGGA